VVKYRYLDSDPLQGPRLKIHRAEEHANALSAEIYEFGKLRAKGSRADYNAQIGAYEFHTLDDWTIPLEWSLLVGDCLNNARSCLDHLFWLLEGRPDPKQERVQFPIFNDARTLKFVRAKPSIRQLIEGVQPRNRLRDEDLLWCLSEMNNADKHRLLMVAASALGGAQFAKLPDRSRLEWVHARLEQDAVFLRYRAQPTEQVDLNPQVSGVPVFDEGPAVGREVLVTLGDLILDIRSNILDRVTAADLP